MPLLLAVTQKALNPAAERHTYASAAPEGTAEDARGLALDEAPTQLRRQIEFSLVKASKLIIMSFRLAERRAGYEGNGKKKFIPALRVMLPP